MGDIRLYSYYFDEGGWDRATYIFSLFINNNSIKIKPSSVVGRSPVLSLCSISDEFYYCFQFCCHLFCAAIYVTLHPREILSTFLFTNKPD